MPAQIATDEVTLADGAQTFRVLRITPMTARRMVLFAVGAGGNPQRHAGLMERLAVDGAIVVAPHFERLRPPDVAADDLVMRARRLRLALGTPPRDMPVVGVGHSIGAAMLLGLCGGQMWMRDGTQLAIEGEARLQRIVMLTPPTNFFRAPGALNAVHVPIMAWAGTADDITPPEQVEFLRAALGGRTAFDMRIVEEAGHFSFMDAAPNRENEPHPDRPVFVAALADEICRFAAG